MRFHFARLMAVGLICCCPLLAGAPEKEPKHKLVLQAPPATSVDSVAVSPDGSLVATAAGEGGVRLYDARTGALLRAIGEAGDRGVSFSPDGRTLAAAGFHMDKLVGVFDVQTGKRRSPLAGHTEWEAYATAFSPDGKLLASTGTDKQILVWELATGKLRHQLKDQPFRVSALAFSPDSATLASGGGDRLVRLWDMTTGQLRRLAGGARRLDLHARLLAGRQDDRQRELRLGLPPRARLAPAGREAPGGERVAAVGCGLGQAPADRDRDGANAVAWPFRPTASRSPAESIRTCGCTISRERRGGRVVTSHDATVTSVAFTPDGAAVISGSHDQTVKRTSLATGKRRWQAPGYFEQVNSVALSDDGSLLVTGSSDHRFARGKLAGRGASNRAGGGPAVGRPDGPPAAPAGRIRPSRSWRSRFRPTDDASPPAVAVASGKAFVRVWDAATGKLAWSAKDHEQRKCSRSRSVRRVARWLPAAPTAWSRSATRRRAGCCRTLIGPQGGATSLAFSPDGKTLVCGEGARRSPHLGCRTGQIAADVCQAAGLRGGAIH